MSVTSKLKIACSTKEVVDLDSATVTLSNQTNYSKSLVDGAGLDAADVQASIQVTLAAASTKVVDLLSSGAGDYDLEDGLGNAVVFATIKRIVIEHISGTSDYIEVYSSDAFCALRGVMYTGGLLLMNCPNAGVPVNTSYHLMALICPSGGDGAVVKITFVGVSA